MLRTMLKWAGLVLAFFLVAGAAIVAASWAPDRPVESLKARWAPPPSQFVRIEGLDVHLRDEGPRDDPLPIVLIHGTSASLHTWHGWTTALRPTRRVIRFDLPAFGLTGPAPDGDYTLARYARFVSAVLDERQVKRAVLAGNSLGGAVAWKTAVDHPDRVAALVLVDSAGYPFASESVPLGFRVARLPAIAPLIRNVLPRRVIESSVRNVYGDPSRVTPRLVDRYYELTLREGNREALVRRFQVVQKEDLSAQIPRVRQPTLILWGAQDRLIPPAQAQRFRSDIAGSTVEVFDGLGHVPHEEDPARTLAPVRAFLARL